MRREALASAVALSQSRFDVEERGPKPGEALVRTLLRIDLGAALLDEGIDGLETVRGLKGSAEHAVAPRGSTQDLFQALGEPRGFSCKFYKMP